MMCSFSYRPTFVEHQDEVIGKLLSIVDSKHILDHVKAREKIGWGNLNYLLDAIKDFPQEVVAERIQIITAKAQRTETLYACYKANPTRSTSKPKKSLVLSNLTALCNENKRCHTEWARWGDFANHFKKYHLDALKKEGYWECCARRVADADKFLRHIWEAHMEFRALHLPMSRDPWVPPAATGPTSTPPYSALFPPPISVTSDSTFSSRSPYEASMSIPTFANVSSHSSFAPPQPAMLPNNDYALGIPNESNTYWPDHMVSGDPILPHHYNTVPNGWP